jgi:hypothetical protein
MFRDRTPADYQRMRAEIATFRNEYVAYLNRTLQMVYAGGVPTYDGDRQRLQHLAVRAEQAVNASGVKIALLPPRFFPAPPLEGLASVAFAHEDEKWRNPTGMSGGHHKESYELAVEALDSADALLRIAEEAVARRRRKPLYWADRLLRAVLGFPAYLISLVLGFDRHDLSPEGGRVLWLVSLAADIAGLFGLGRLIGWW